MESSKVDVHDIVALLSQAIQTSSVSLNIFVACMIITHQKLINVFLNIRQLFHLSLKQHCKRKLKYLLIIRPQIQITRLRLALLESSVAYLYSHQIVSI